MLVVVIDRQVNPTDWYLKYVNRNIYSQEIVGGASFKLETNCEGL